MVAGAANVVLLVVISTFALTGTGSAASGSQFVLPPKDAKNVELVSVVSGGASVKGYGIRYETPDGVVVWLNVGGVDPFTDSGRESADRSLNAIGRPGVWPSTSIDVHAVEGARATCLGVMTSDSTVPGTIDLPGYDYDAGGPIGGIGILDDRLVIANLIDSRACTLDAASVDPIAVVMDSLRVVSEQELYVFLVATPLLQVPLSIDVRHGPSVSIPGEQAARDEIAFAITHLDEVGGPGWYPYLEGGSQLPLATEYSEMFATARAQSGAKPGATFRPKSVVFASDSEAFITFSADVDLGRGPMAFELYGRAIREGDRWVVSRSTVESMVGRSSIPTH